MKELFIDTLMKEMNIAKEEEENFIQAVQYFLNHFEKHNFDFFQYLSQIPSFSLSIR